MFIKTSKMGKIANFIVDFLFFYSFVIVLFLIEIICLMWIFKTEFSFMKPITRKLSEDDDCNVMVIITLFDCVPFVIILIFLISKIDAFLRGFRE